MSKVSEVVDYYHLQLGASEEAQQYLKSRGITTDTIAKFQLGYCPAETEFVPRFRNRIIFPIWDQQGVLVGWTGRTLVGDPAKYVNVKESAVFKKSRLLYAYNFAKPYIIKRGTVVLVEGQMDVLMLHQEGILNTVASSGTASFKSAAANLLVRYDPRVYIVFDGDTAGIKAATSAEVHLKNAGVKEVITVLLPEGEDPASFVLKHGRQEFLWLLNDTRQITKTT